MAFRRSFRMGGARGARRSFSRFRRSGSRYEIAQLSVCRRGLELGLSDCNIPDQFFIPLVSGRDWLNPIIQNAADANEATSNIISAHSNRAISVRGIQFDYQYSFVPTVESEPSSTSATGVTSIRSGLVVMACTFAGSLGQLEQPLPLNPDSNILFHTGALRNDTDQGAGINQTEFSRKYRILWRGLDMMSQIILPSNFGNSFSIATFQTPSYQTSSRHVRLRTGCRLGDNEALFLVCEVVNPFLEENPGIGLDLFGSCAIKTVSRGNQYER